MHICFVFHREYPATQSTAIQNYADTLTDLGHSVSGVFARTGNEPASEHVDGVSVYRIDSDTSSAVSLAPTEFGWRAMRKCREIHDRSPIDVVHLHAFPGLGAVLDTPKWAPPTVADVRGTAVRNAAFEAASRLGLTFQRRLVDEMAVISERVADHVFLSPDGLSILPIGVDVDAFATATGEPVREELAESSEELLLGYVGGLHESRELDTLISAYKKVDGPTTRLLVIGDGRDRTALEAHAASIGLENEVTFTGSILHSEVPSYLAALDIGLAWIPDRPQYRNQPPLKTVEYLAAGLPVIATPTPGNLEFCSSRNSVLSSFDMDTFGADLERLVRNESLRQSVANHATESAAEYDYETIVRDRLLPIYRKAIEQNSSSRPDVTYPRDE